MNLSSDQLQFMPIYVVIILQLKKNFGINLCSDQLQFMLTYDMVNMLKLNKHKFELV